MARKPRYHHSGAFYHLMLRGNDGQKIFFSDADRCRMCLLIQQGVERYGHRIHAFCLMSNHIHLLVQVAHTPISKIVHNLAFRYSQGINRRYGKIGHLFQGRFKSILLEESDYFLKLIRYIHMNPVRAKLVSKPEDYQWSGHRAYLGIDDDIVWLTIDYALAKFDNVLGQARHMYNDYILKIESKEELNELRMNFKDSQVLGNDDFLEEIRETNKLESEPTIPLSVILDAACQVFGIEKTMLSSFSQSRKLSLARGAIVLHAQEIGMSLEDIAIAFKRNGSTLSSLRSRFLQKYRNCEDLKHQVDKLKEKARQLADLQA